MLISVKYITVAKHTYLSRLRVFILLYLMFFLVFKMCRSVSFSDLLFLLSFSSFSLIFLSDFFYVFFDSRNHKKLTTCEYFFTFNNQSIVSHYLLSISSYIYAGQLLEDLICKLLNLIPESSLNPQSFWPTNPPSSLLTLISTTPTPTHWKLSTPI